MDGHANRSAGGKARMPSTTNLDSLGLTRLAIPKGRIEPGVTGLLAAAGI